MVIDTTVYMKIELCNILINIEKKYGHSRRKIISSLLRRLADDKVIFPKPWKRIQYQKRSPKNEWRRFHLYLREDEYEFFLDLRKFYKRSISYLIAFAMDCYLDDINKIGREPGDNYPYKNYMLSRMVIEKITCWILYWGVPEFIITYPQSESPP